MKSKITWLCLIISLIVNLELKAQKTRPNYQLLWKISGNGLKKPSYLFGTMHLRDKRVFDFSDSVLVKLEECETFAMEVTPDSMLTAAFQLLMEDEDDNSYNIKDKLSDKEFEDLKVKLQNENIDINWIKNKEPKKILELISNPLPHKTDKETFLDAYLYRIAKENNKTIVGLEKIKEHVDAYSYDDQIKDLKTYIKYEGIEKTQSLVDVYWEGNISKIETYFSNADSVYLEHLLFKRNKKMHEKMIELMAEKSTFTAVGAAHLPGELGLIKLLKNSGYTVTPVQASFTGLAARYKEKPLVTDWIKFDVEEHLYSASFPSKPFLYSKNDLISLSTKLYIYPDMSTGLFYYSFAYPLATLSEDPYSFTSSYVKAFSSNRGLKVISRKKTLYNNYPAEEILLSSNTKGFYIKLQLVIRKNSLFALMLGSFNQSLLASNDAEKFFHSLELKEYKKSSWTTLKSEEGAFTVQAPFEMTKSTHKIPSGNGPTEMNMYTCTDQKKGIAYFLFYYNFYPGMIILEDSVYFANAVTNIADRIQGTVTESKDIVVDGYKGKSFLISSDKGSYRGQILMRGNRPYAFFCVASETVINDPSIYEFIDSFHLTEFKPAEWELYTSEKYNFKLKVPSKVRVDVDSTDGDYYETFNSQDKNSGTSYILRVEKFSTYDYEKKEDFLSRIVKNQVSDSEDSLVWEKDIKLSGIEGKEVLVRKKETHNLIRNIFIPADDYLYHLVVYNPQKYIESPQMNQFFASFQFTGTIKKPTVYESKTKKILEDIASSDSATFEKANSALYRYDFDKADLPLLYEAIQKNYPDDSNQYHNTKFELISKLEKLNDDATIPFIGKLYNTDTSSMVKIRALKVLTNIGTDEAIDKFISLTEKSIPVPATDFIPYGLFRPFTDSLELNKKNLPKLFYLIKTESYRSDIYRLAITLIDSNAIDLNFFNAHKNDIISYAKENMIKSIGKGPEYYTGYGENYNSIRLISRIKQDTATSNYLNLAASTENLYLRLEAVKGQLKNGYTVNPKNIEKIAAEKETRIELYSALLEYNKSNLFPVKWLKQVSFAEASVYNYLTDYDDYSPSKVELVGKKLMNYKGENKLFYLFKVSFDEDGTYPVLCGPYSSKESEMNIKPEMLNISYDTTFKSKSINEYYTGLLKEEE